MLFFKRICDVWDEEYTAAVDTYGQDFEDEHRFQVPADCHWEHVRQTPANVGTALQNAMRCIEVANQEHLYGVFGDAQWTNKDRLPDPLLKDLIEHFSQIKLGNQRITSDVIGDAASLFRKGRAQNFLDPEHVDTILHWVQDFAAVEDRARVVTVDEIAAEDWTLNISRYVLPPIGADIPPLDEATANFKTALARCRDAEEELRRVMGKTLSGNAVDATDTNQ